MGTQLQMVKQDKENKKKRYGRKIIFG